MQRPKWFSIAEVVVLLFLSWRCRRLSAKRLLPSARGHKINVWLTWLCLINETRWRLHVRPNNSACQPGASASCMCWRARELQQCPHLQLALRYPPSQGRYKVNHRNQLLDTHTSTLSYSEPDIHYIGGGVQNIRQPPSMLKLCPKQCEIGPRLTLIGKPQAALEIGRRVN